MLLDQSQTLHNTYNRMRSTSIGYLANSFIPTVSAGIAQISLLLFKVGTPTGNIWVDIYTDNATSPGTLLCTSNNMSVSALTTDQTNGDLYNFTFSNAAILSLGVKYWIVFNGDYTLDTNNCALWFANNPGNASFGRWIIGTPGYFNSPYGSSDSVYYEYYFENMTTSVNQEISISENLLSKENLGNISLIQSTNIAELLFLKENLGDISLSQTFAIVEELILKENLGDISIFDIISLQDVIIAVDPVYYFSISIFDVVNIIETLTYTTDRVDYNNYSNLPNSYFLPTSAYDNERKLYDLILAESFNKYGVPMVYYVSTYDLGYYKIFGEDGNRRYNRFFNIMAYYDLPKELEQWSKFGIEGMDTFQMFVSKKHFDKVSNSYIPRSGDVIQAKYNNRFYEIVDVGEEEYIFLQKKHTWTFTVKVFRDEHISVDNSISATDLANYTNKDSDIFDVSAAVDVKKSDILYTSAGSDKNTDSIWGQW